MNNKFPSLIKRSLLCSIILISACSVLEQTEPIETRSFPPLSTIVSSGEINSTPSPIIVETLTPLTPTNTLILEQLATDTPTPAVEKTPDILPTPTITTSALFEGPLIAFRVQNGENYLLLLDVGTLTLREVKQEHLVIPFVLEWLDDGCHLFARGNVIDLQGNIVEKTNDPEDGSVHFQVQLLSPDRMRGVSEVFLGSHEDMELDFLNLEILDRTDPDWHAMLAPNGGAYAYSWSPDGAWLAFSDFDENSILQVYRATSDGQIVEQLTSHLEDPGVINIIEWSPDGQHIAYAAQAFLSEQFEHGGWIGLISLPDLRTVTVKPDHFQYAKGLWWSEDSSRIAFVGESFYEAPDALKGTQMNWVDRDSGTILNSFYQDQAPTQFFNFVVPVGDLDTVFFETKDGYYLLDATTQSYEKILDDIPTDGLIRDFVSSPFNFPGEATCLADN